MSAQNTAPPTISEVCDELREEWDALGMMSYHGTGIGIFYADLTIEDIDQIRALLRQTAQAIEELS